MKMQNYKLSTLLTSPIAVPHQQSGETSVHPQCLHLLLLNSWTTFATAYINMYDRLNFVTDLFEDEYFFSIKWQQERKLQSAYPLSRTETHSYARTTGG